MANLIQSVGDFQGVFVHPLVGGGTAINLRCLKLDESFVESDQLVDNSKTVPLLNGDAISLTNCQKAGSVTVNSIRVSDDPLQGDLVACGKALQEQADSFGGMLTFSWSLGGVRYSRTFQGVTIARVPPLLMAGNDIRSYPTKWNYCSYE